MSIIGNFITNSRVTVLISFASAYACHEELHFSNIKSSRIWNAYILVGLANSLHSLAFRYKLVLDFVAGGRGRWSRCIVFSTRPSTAVESLSPRESRENTLYSSTALRGLQDPPHNANLLASVRALSRNARLHSIGRSDISTMGKALSRWDELENAIEEGLGMSHEDPSSAVQRMSIWRSKCVCMWFRARASVCDGNGTGRCVPCVLRFRVFVMVRSR